MTKNKKLTAFIIVGLAAIVVLAVIAYKMVSNNKPVQEKKPVANQWRMIEGDNCYLDSEGNPVTGWVQIAPKDGCPNDEEWCYFDESGRYVDCFDKNYDGRTAIFVDISKQMLTFFDKGTSKLTAHIISGTKGKDDTPTGEYDVVNKNDNSRIVGPDWDYDHVVWIGFIGNDYGIHSAWWQEDALFDDPTSYYEHGSHGCINMRENDARKLYDLVDIGTKVIIQE